MFLSRVTFIVEEDGEWEGGIKMIELGRQNLEWQNGVGRGVMRGGGVGVVKDD